jgi:hypothetical protein
MNTEVAKTAEPDDERVAKVTRLPSNWSLVEYGTWAVSVGPDAQIMLPRSLKPTEAGDFCAAVMAAAEVGLQVKTANEAAGAKDDRSLPGRRVMLREGEPPPGAVRLPVKAGPTGSIGHRGGQRRANQPPPRGSAGFPTATPAPRQSNRGR